jgi:thiamine-phosphate pyrophosphorylase
MLLIIISNPEDFKSEHKILLRLFEAGLENFHLRKPDYSVDDYEKYIEHIPEKYHKNIVVYKYLDLHNKYNLKGIHFSRDNRNRINEFKQYKIQKSISCHSFDDILNLSGFRYACLSPVFDSISKEGYRSKFILEDIAEFFQKNILTTKVVALGGISSGNVEQALSAGFDGAAVMGALWNNIGNERDIDRTVNYFIELNKKCQQFVRTY